MINKWQVDIRDKAALTRFMLTLAVFVEAILEKNGELLNMYLLFDHEGNNGHVLKPAFGLPPERVTLALNKMIRMTKGTPMAIGMVVHMSEAWGAELVKGVTDDRPPSERDDRWECYIIEAKTLHGDTFYINRRFDRGAEGKIVFDDTPPQLAKEGDVLQSQLLDAIFTDV